MSVARPAWAELDLAALRHNVEAVRRLAGPKTRILAVMKGDAYGFGIEKMAPTLERFVDGFAVGDVEEARLLRPFAGTRPILLYGSLMPSDLAVLDEGIIATVHSWPCLEALAGTGRARQVMVKVDCGFGRLGFPETEMPAVLDRIAGMPADVRLWGAYTHLGAVDDAATVALQVQRFESVRAAARQRGMADLVMMVASSRVLVDNPALALDAINPGRILFGAMEEPWASRAAIRPVLRKVAARLIAIKDLPADRRLGYGSIAPGRGTIRVGIAPIGFAAGLPRNLDGAPLLLRGRRTQVLGLASMEHLLVDLEPAGGEVGDEVVLVGSQDSETLTIEDMARHTGLTALELSVRLARGVPSIPVDG
ncbi:MAG: alanine racemase [Rhizobiaceae bacterium]|nr:alanine racemase [Rhizobiaceae bacterium]